VAVTVLVLLVAGGIGTYVWALGHWFVGVDSTGANEEVAIFRGLDASVVGLDLYRLDQTTDLALNDLTPAARNRVRGGITASDSADANRILDALRDQRLPLCPAEPIGGNRSTPTSSAAPTKTRPLPTAGTVGRSPARPTGPAATISRAAPRVTTTSPTRTTPPPEPGVDCREAK
jgi:protein phosphatase